MLLFAGELILTEGAILSGVGVGVGTLVGVGVGVLVGVGVGTFVGVGVGVFVGVGVGVFVGIGVAVGVSDKVGLGVDVLSTSYGWVFRAKATTISRKINISNYQI